MNNKYKIVISNRSLYREVELPVEVQNYKIGTTIDCEFRLHKELFFEEISLDLMNSDGIWSVMCSDNIYISAGDARRLLTTVLTHGDCFVIKYQESGSEVFAIEFMVDFDSRPRSFERRIEIGQTPKITIGAGRENDICLSGEYIHEDKIELVNCRDGLQLEILHAAYGVYHNGNKAENKEIIRNGDFFSISNFAFYYKENCLWTAIDGNCVIRRLTYIDDPNKNNYPVFVRNTRVRRALDESEIEILDPPVMPQQQKSNLLMSLLPSMGMLITSGIMAFMGGAMIVFSALSGAMAIVTTITGVIQGKRDYKRETKERIEKYHAYITNKRAEIEECRKQERDVLNEIYPSRDENMDRFRRFSTDLFDRRKEDEDFLNIRLGTGSIEAVRKINYKKQEKLELEDELQEMPQQICEEYRMLADAPVVCRLREMNAIGITGTEEERYGFLKGMVLDIIARQFHSDVKLFFVAEEEHADRLENFRFLPHVNDTIGNMRNIVCGEESKKVVFECLYNILTEREEQKEYGEHYIIFLYDHCGFGSHPVSKFVDKAKDLGVTFIFFAGSRAEIPMGCDRIISLCSQDEAELTDTSGAFGTVPFCYDTCTDDEIAYITRLMAAVVTEEISLECGLTKNIDLFQLLYILGVDDLDLGRRWASGKVYESMAVPLGVSRTGVVYLDLHDKAHGPHGLVAGTTGSGKSEILQTYILSIATYFHPYEVAFVIIDFKGGGMVNQFKELPHLLGAITNIDGKEIDRSLKSIKAELQKRQRLFAEAEVNHIDKYIKKYKAGSAGTPLPHLIIIVDEFAELKAEQPEFMKELISAARIGRSLGVHLILATQKPAGQVDDQIWSNSRFKLCLKVQGPEDSNEVLKSPLAAEIKEPGRAYLQVGNNEIFELFQSAYSGAAEQAADDSVKAFQLLQLDLSGKRTVIFEQKKQQAGGRGKTQLEAIVEYVASYCERAEIGRLPGICLEALKESIDFAEEGFEKTPFFDIGIYDDPDQQYQGNTLLDISGRHTFIIGSSQYGKTNLLQLLIRETVLKYSPREANIYILDFGSMVLKNFEALNHVGGVVCASDDEKLKNLFKLLQEEIADRKEKLVSTGVSSFGAYCEAGHRDLPRIFVFVDNMTALMELYLENDDTFLGIIREGLAVGISVVIANAQTAGIGYKYFSNLANRIALYCNDTNEYGNLFDHVTLKPDEVPGRCIVELDKRILECQTYLAFRGDREFERVQEIREFIEAINSRYARERAKVIPFIPSLLTVDVLEQEFAAGAEDYRLAMGLSYSEVSPFCLDFAGLGALGLCGKEKKGHHNFIAGLLGRLNGRREKCPVKVTILDDVSRKYKELSRLEIVETYSLDTSVVLDKIGEWHAILEERYQAMMEEREVEDNALLMLVIQNNDVAGKIFEDMDVMNQYRDIVTRFQALNVCVIYANYGNCAVPYDAPEPLRMIKQEQHLLLFDDLDSLKVFDVPYEEMKANKKKLQMGDAYYIRDNAVTRIKLVKADAS